MAGNEIFAKRLRQLRERKHMKRCVLAELCGIRMVRALQYIELGACTLEESRILDVSAGFPVFSLRRMTYDEHDMLAEYTESKYRSDRYKFTIEMT